MPAFKITRRVVGRKGAGQDRAWAKATGESVLVVLADGAGGLGGGARAADLCVELLSVQLAHSDATPLDLLVNADRDLFKDPKAGESTVVTARIAGDRIDGASIGDSSAWLVSPDGVDDLTAAQIRKPMLGSGAAQPVPFTATLGAATLLIASDGLVKYAPSSTIGQVINATDDLEAAADALVDAVRLRSGALQDDVSLLLLRARS